MTTATITPEEFEKAVRLECLKSVARDARSNPYALTDEGAVRYGPFLRDIAKTAGLSIPQARRQMKKLQDAGRVLRDDSTGGCTRWWLKGLGVATGITSMPVPPAAPAVHATPSPATARQAVTAQPVPARQHWSEVLGVSRDCSPSEARQAFTAAIAAVPEHDLDAEQQRQRIRDAYNARLVEDGISE
jgi:hypothetical protein